jgi:hypothetical protein
MIRRKQERTEARNSKGSYKAVFFFLITPSRRFDFGGGILVERTSSSSFTMDDVTRA